MSAASSEDFVEEPKPTRSSKKKQVELISCTAIHVRESVWDAARSEAVRKLGAKLEQQVFKAVLRRAEQRGVFAAWDDGAVPTHVELRRRGV